MSYILRVDVLIGDGRFDALIRIRRRIRRANRRPLLTLRQTASIIQPKSHRLNEA